MFSDFTAHVWMYRDALRMQASDSFGAGSEGIVAEWVSFAVPTSLNISRQDYLKCCGSCTAIVLMPTDARNSCRRSCYIWRNSFQPSGEQ